MPALPLIIDNFAGGGGASTGIEAAMGRKVDVAINHDEAAIAVHTANHPETKHYCQSIYSVDPLDATGGEPVLLAWFSPDCKHHSKAKGGKPREKYIRDMAHVVPHWIERLLKATPGGRGVPQVIMLENVEEFRQWGPLDEKGKPIPERKGEEFDLWVRRIRRLGYKVEWRALRGCDFGAPTSRKRLFLIARRDGKPIVWPEPTHGAPGSAEVLAGQRLPWRTAAECIDWSLACPSIFDRARPLKPATCRRIAAGVMRYVVKSARPFIVPVTHTHGGNTAQSVDEPLRTVTTAKGGEFALTAASLIKVHGTVTDGIPSNEGEEDDDQGNCGRSRRVAGACYDQERRADRPEICLDRDRGAEHATRFLHPLGHADRRYRRATLAGTIVQTGYGERVGQAPRALDPGKPLGTVVAGGAKHAAVAAFLAQHHRLPATARPLARVHRMPPGADRAKERSRFFPGIAAAMAAQWGDLLDREAA